MKIAANDDQSAVHGIAFQVLRFFLRHDANAIAILRRQPENTRSLTPSRSQDSRTRESTPFRRTDAGIAPRHAARCEGACAMNAESGRMPGDKPTIRVLVVDDHPIGRLLLQGQLKALGYDVELAEEGNAALQRFAEAHYDVVMTDLNMPGMDGCSLARNLRSRGVTVPILAFTATANDAERKGCAAAGIDALFTKPLVIDAVDATVRRLIGLTVAPDLPAAKSNDLTHGPLPAKVRDLLQQSFHQSIQAIDETLSNGDMQVVRDHLHSLRGSFAMIRELETVDRLGRMEEQAAAGDREALQSALHGFAEHALSVLRRRT